MQNKSVHFKSRIKSTMQNRSVHFKSIQFLYETPGQKGLQNLHRN